MALAEREAVLPLAAKSCPKLVALNGATGYFHQAHDEAGWTALAAHLDTLAPDEQIAAVDGVRAAFASGALTPSPFIDVLTKAAKTPDARLLAATVDHVQALESALPDGTGDAYQSWVRGALTPALARVAKTSDLALNKTLMRALAVNGRDATLRGRLSEAGRAMLNGESVGSTLPRPLALRVAVEDGGPGIFATLLKNAKASDDVLFRLEALSALGHAPRPEDRTTFAESLKSFEVYENVLTIYELSTEPASSVFAWELAKANFERLRGLSASLSANYPILARNLCTAEGRADVQAFVAANAKKMDGHEATLAQTVDEIDHCVALRAGQGAPLADALKAKGTAVAARRRLRDVDALLAGFIGPQKAAAPLDMIAACGRKYPDPSPLAICAATPTPKACSDVRIMLEQCLAAPPLE
jgi:alanyl aminopeptidase